MKLSIVILNYNTEELLQECLLSLKAIRGETSFEVIVVDNASKDNSREMVHGEFPWVKLIKNESNLGFAKGNNKARGVVSGENVLMLNSDTIVHKGTLARCLEYLDKNPDVGALTCKTVLPSGQLDPDARRSFPTPWVALTHFSGLDMVFPKSKLFARYWYGYISPKKIHEVEVLQGAFCMVRREILDKIGWYDEDYFLDGEDIDLCWKIKREGWKIIYYPEVSILHVKKGTKGKYKSLKFIMSGVESMEIFYKKRLWAKYPIVVNFMVLLGIRIIRSIRYTKLLFLK